MMKCGGNQTSLRSVIRHYSSAGEPEPMHRERGRKSERGRGKREPVGMAKDFDFQFPVNVPINYWVAGHR